MRVPGMKITVIAAKELTSELVSQWSQIQRADPNLASPYFRPEFSQAVAAVRNDVEVAVMRQEGEAIGFFPYQRSRWNVAMPVGGQFSDYQAVILRKGVEWEPEELVRGCGLRAWHFDHLIVSLEQCNSYHILLDESPYLDLSGGFESYRTSRVKAGSKLFRQTARKARKMERELGPLRFVPHTTEQAVFEKLIEWKSDQYRETETTNAFSHRWTVELLERIRLRQDESFGGMLSALYAGERLVAAHFGMRSYGVLHGWFPTYDRELSRYSPGLIQFIELAKAAESLGIRLIDLGRGLSRYKRGLMSGTFRVAEGSVDLRPVTRLLRSGFRSACDWGRSSPLRGPARIPARVLRHFSEWLALRK